MARKHKLTDGEQANALNRQEELEKHWDRLDREEREGATNLPPSLDDIDVEGAMANFSMPIPPPPPGRQILSTTCMPVTIQFLDFLAKRYGRARGHVVDEIARQVRKRMIVNGHLPKGWPNHEVPKRLLPLDDDE